jgi:hypothetical protein
VSMITGAPVGLARRVPLQYVASVSTINHSM